MYQRVQAKVEIDNILPDDLQALVFRNRSMHGPTVRVFAVGDLGFSGRVALTASRDGYESLFDEVRSFLRTGDIVFGNLEYPLAAEVQPDKMFAGDPQAAVAMRDAGFRLVHLANNHVGEYGAKGLGDTLTAVRGANLTPLGVGEDDFSARQLVRTDINGIRIGWLACGRTLLPQIEEGPRYWEFDETELYEAVRRERPNIDVLIVSIHIGLMYVDYPRPDHKTMADRLMQAGASLILMHHAHVLQGVEVTPTGAICCYNLGNFLLDWSEGNVEMPIMVKEQNESAIFSFLLDGDGVAEATVIPTFIDDDCRVKWATGVRGEEILSRLERISRDLEGDFTGLFEAQRAARNTEGILKVLCFHLWRGNWRYLFQSLSRARLEHVGMMVRWLSAAIFRTSTK